MARDNGEAGAGGQRPRGLFPSLLRGLWDRMNPVDESAFQQGFDALAKLLEAGSPNDHVVTDEKGRGTKKVGVPSTFNTSNTSWANF
jgi:hypothetical protein